MDEVVIISAVRTAIGRYGRSLLPFSATKLGAMVIGEAVKRANIEPADVQEVIMGNVVSAGLGQNPARQAAIYGGIPVEVPATTVNKVCASSLKAVVFGTDAIKAGNYDTMLAGGMESMSNCPYLAQKARWGYRLGTNKLVDAMVNDGLWDIYNDFHMGMTGEIIADKYEITREQMDQFSYESHMKAAKATDEGLFKEEIMPVEIPQRKVEPVIFDKDEGIRRNTTPEALAKLRTEFKKDGMLTAGNCSQLSDGGSAVVIMSADKAKERGLEPLAKITGYVSVGVKPELVMEAPIPAIKMLLEKLGKTINDIDVYEHNEAFASASCAVMKGLSIPPEKFNVHGGAVALGHPIGASGARVLTTLIYAMKNRDAKTGIATLCLGGGNAIAMSIEM
ncbi:MAG: acetyl-CoA C-acetyltransferase [Methanomassiliicoccales archaeon]|nr:MAG: acetyl-CoA C-acetyltransferase [Methanomassiliicoccales archaeon]